MRTADFKPGDKVVIICDTPLHGEWLKSEQTDNGILINYIKNNKGKIICSEKHLIKVE